MQIRRFAPRCALLALLVAAAAWVALHKHQFDAALIDALIAAVGPWGPLLHILLFAIGTVAFIPGSIFAVAGGALFGPVWGTMCNLLGATLGATAAFLVARYVAGEWVERRADGRLKRLIEGVDAEGWRFVAFVRLVPLFPFNLSNYALGLTRISVREYVLATIICMLPGSIAYTWVGYAGRSALAGGSDALRYALLALALLAMIAFLPRFIVRLRRSFSWLETAELRRRLDNGEPVTVIDVRGKDEFWGALGHIAKARNIPIAELNERLPELAGLERTPVVLVCLTDKRSAKGADLLSRAGYREVSVLRRGMQQWNADGLPVERNAVNPAP
jgi:uncharacterized membrane protein YdjX (TVP38/TMEM64 family)/rhodanese-related sulfurtransferase